MIKHHLTGFIVSATLHAGLISGAMMVNKESPKPKTHTDEVMLMVSLFKAEPALKPAPVEKQVKEEAIEKKAEKEVLKKRPEAPRIETKPELVAPPKIAALVVETLEKKPAPIVKATKQVESKIKPKKKIIKKVVAKKPKSKLTPLKRKPVKKSQPKLAHKYPKKRPKKVIVRAVQAKPRPKHKTKPVRRVVKATPKRAAKVVARAPRRVTPIGRVAKPVRVVRRTPARVAPVARSVATRTPARPVAKRPAVQAMAARKPRAAYHKAKVTPKRVVPSAQASQLSRQYKARLHRLIVSKKRYPKRARRRGQQGKVTLSFSISHSGTISQVRIIKSSGNTLLDNAAMQAMQKSSHQLPFSAGMPKTSLKLSLTLSYILK